MNDLKKFLEILTRGEVPHEVDRGLSETVVTLYMRERLTGRFNTKKRLEVVFADDRLVEFVCDGNE